MNRTAESNLALSLGISRAYSPFLSDAESEALRLETERRDALVRALRALHRVGTGELGAEVWR